MKSCLGLLKGELAAELQPVRSPREFHGSGVRQFGFVFGRWNLFAGGGYFDEGRDEAEVLAEFAEVLEPGRGVFVAAVGAILKFRDGVLEHVPINALDAPEVQ